MVHLDGITEQIIEYLCQVEQHQHLVLQQLVKYQLIYQVQHLSFYIIILNMQINLIVTKEEVDLIGL